MGFLSDIIRDSKKPVGRSIAKGTVRGTSSAAERPPARITPRETVAPLNDGLTPVEKPLTTFWEEEAGQSRATRAQAQPSEPEDRQVVGPSLSENTEGSDLAKAPEDSSSSPDHGKQKQTGLKNRSDVTVQKMNRDLTLHGVVSFDKEKSGSEDPSVMKPVSKHLEQSAREKSVDVTHRSRQAGQTTRAGATTPPNSITPDRPATTPAHPASESSETPHAPADAKPSPSDVETPPETEVPKTDVSLARQPESLEERGEPRAPAFPADSEEKASPVRSDLPADEETVGLPVSQRETMAADDVDIPPQSPVEVFFPDQQAPEPLQAEPRVESMSQTGTRKPVAAPDGPEVHIGLLEVVVLAPESTAGRKASKSPEGHNFASRHYLRNL